MIDNVAAKNSTMNLLKHEASHQKHKTPQHIN